MKQFNALVLAGRRNEPDAFSETPGGAHRTSTRIRNSASAISATQSRAGRGPRPRPTDDVSFFESLCLNYLLIDGISYTGVSEIVIVFMYSVFIIALTVKVLFKWR